MKPITWTHPPADFEHIVWHGNGKDIGNIEGVIHPIKHATIFKFELTNEERHQLVEGNPIYLSILGKVAPFMISVNLGELTEVIRSK